MSTMKFLGQKRDQLIKPEFECDFKEESTQSSYPEFPFAVKYVNYSPTKITSLKLDLYPDNWDEKKKSKDSKLKLNDDTFKIEKRFKIDFKKAEKVVPPKNKSISMNEIYKNEKEYLYHFLFNKNYSINELKEINLSKNIPDQKFHMILDIDSTMIKAVDMIDKPKDKKKDDFEIRGTVDEKTHFEFYCRYRPFLFHFISELKDYFNFYISTLGYVNYANQIIEDLIQKAEISIPHIVSNKSPGQKLVKSLNEIIPISNFEEEYNKTVIIDDIINYWIKPPISIKEDNEIKQCIKCLIPSRRYIINTAKGADLEKFGILIHNNILEDEYNNSLSYSIPVDYSYCIEKDKDSENGKKGQFFYLTIFMKKCIKFCLYSGKSLVDAMDFIRKKVFENCKFNLRYLDNDWSLVISKLINELGGEIVLSPDETTHFIIRDEINKEKVTWLKNDQYLININYIFLCYFNLYRMSELENSAFAKEKKPNNHN